MPPVPSFAIRLSPQGRRAVVAVLWMSAVVGLLLGIETLVLHLSTDPLIDIKRYYLAGQRLNEGLPLYGQTSSDTTATYLYPPLLAILFRPLAMLPYPVVAALWETLVLLSFALTLRRVGLRRPVLLVVAWLALPIGWALAIGQVEPVLTLLLVIGAPWAVALAGSVKLLPWLAAAYWVGRREWRSLAKVAAWVVGLFAVQLALAPDATIAFLRLEWLHATLEVNNVGLWVVSPVLWAAGALLAGVAALAYAGTRLGWAAAVVFTVLANPRLLVYQLMSLIAAFGGPRASSDPEGPA